MKKFCVMVVIMSAAFGAYATECYEGVCRGDMLTVRTVMSGDVSETFQVIAVGFTAFSERLSPGVVIFFTTFLHLLKTLNF